MTPEQYQREATELWQRISDVCKGADHDVVLGALFSLYRQVVLANPCCAQNAANFCMVTAMEFANLASREQAGQVSPGPAHVH